ncbi:MAG: outer membrane protein assembly factor BamB family protein [Kineosporiaceae bacterium]
MSTGRVSFARRLVPPAVATLTVGALLAACGGSTPPSPPPSPSPSPSPSRTSTGSGWTTYHGETARTGFSAEPATVHTLTRVRSVHLDGAVYGQPVVAPAAGGDVVVAATENDTVVALRDGQAIWSTQLGGPVPLGDLPCGNIDPLGITGTPVVDTASHTVYVVAELANPIRHELVALDTSTGAVRWRRTVDPPGSQPRYSQQRAALALAAGRVWVAMGGLFGDCGPYHGTVAGVRSDGGGDLVVYQVPSAREAGIWAPSGPALGPQGHLFVAVGNGAATSGAWDGSDSVLELDTSGRLVSSFAPAGWAQENAHDLDLGSMGPLVLPRGLVVASGKRGDVYVLRQGDLGGVGNPLAHWTGCAAYGGPAADVRSAPSGSVLAYLPCADGDVALRIDLTSGAIRRRWHAESAVAGSPVVVGDAVLSVDRAAGRLVALDAASGRQRAAVAIGPVSRFATPLLDGGRAVVGTLDGVAEISLG